MIESASPRASVERDSAKHRERSRGGLVILDEIPNLERHRFEAPSAFLVRARPEEEVDDAALVRLEPVELDGGDRTDVQPVDVDGVEKPPLELRVRR